MQRIVPNIWFNQNAAEAAAYYAEIFPGGRVTGTQYYPTQGLPDFQAEMAGKVLTVDFEVGGSRIIGINAGPEFPVNPSISFMLNFDPSMDPQARDHLDELWEKLADGGQVLMPLTDYPFSPRYGWVADRYGVTWQLILTNPEGEPRPFVIPSLMFGQAVQNKAGEALEFYAEVFAGQVGMTAPYPTATGPAAAGSLMFGEVELFGQWLTAMDSAVEQDFSFTCGVSLMVLCADQAELDRYWERLSAVPEAEICGWCADRFGVSWQLVPADLDALMAKPGAYEKLMAMTKIDIGAFG